MERRRLPRHEPPDAGRVRGLRRRGRAAPVAVPAVVRHQRQPELRDRPTPASGPATALNAFQTFAILDCLLVAACVGAVHPRLDHRPRAQAHLEAGRGHDDRRHHRLRADPLQRDHPRPARRRASRSRSRSATSSGCSPASAWPSAASCARRATPRAASPPASSSTCPTPSGARPDRNLALELVRTTEYAALAAARWIGRGREGVGRRRRRRRHAADARHGADGRRRGDRRGREGRGARCSTTASRSATARRPRWTSRSTRSRAPSCAPSGLPNSLAVIALSERGTMFDPGPCVYMNKMATSKDMAHLLDFDRPAGRDARADRQGEGHVGRRRGGDHARPPAPRRRGRRRSARPAPASASSRTATCPRRSSRCTPGSPVDLLWGIGGTPGGRAVRLRDQVHRRQDHRPALAARRRTSARPRSTPATTSTRCSTPTGSCPGENVFFSATGVTDGDMLARRALPGPRGRHHRVAGHALALGHRAHGHADHDRAKLREITGERVG